MNNKIIDNIKTMIIVIILVIFTRMIGSLPWWSFVIPVLIFGVVISLRKWNVSSFSIGFLSGFIIWFVANFYVDLVNNGIVLNKIALILTVNKIILLIISGIIGGLLTGLALYTGKNISDSSKISNLDQRMK